MPNLLFQKVHLYCHSLDMPITKLDKLELFIDTAKNGELRINQLDVLIAQIVNQMKEISISQSSVFRGMHQ